jgi:hypothetical protein
MFIIEACVDINEWSEICGGKGVSFYYLSAWHAQCMWVHVYWGAGGGKSMQGISDVEGKAMSFGIGKNESRGLGRQPPHRTFLPLSQV